MWIGMKLQKEIRGIAAIAEVVIDLTTDKLLDRVVLDCFLLRYRSWLRFLRLFLLTISGENLKLLFAR